ncbi:MAG: hypothetical protein NC343_05255 [Muribaculum sp.]|nr:hypothetical protein [Muribaculaceae bacterium]MCM1081138.1 hypothetical protein [Muribaculum sp.]
MDSDMGTYDTNNTPGIQAGEYETATAEEVKQETVELNSLNYNQEDNPANIAD